MISTQPSHFGHAMRRLRLTHYYYRRTGFYPFLLNTLLKVAIGLGALVVVLIIVEKHVVSLDVLMGLMMDRFPPWAILLTFFVAESILGLLPPDLFIIWSQQFDQPWQMITIVGAVSTSGGIMAYLLGKWLLGWTRFRVYLEQRFAKYLVMLNKWGPLLVLLAALTPLPYGAICTLAGLIGMRLPLFLAYNLARFFRFFLYALVLFQVV